MFHTICERMNVRWTSIKTIYEFLWMWTEGSKCVTQNHMNCASIFFWTRLVRWIQLLLVNFPWFMVHQFSKMFHLWFNPIFWFPGWWFQTFFIFHFIYGMSSQPHWRSPSFFKMVKLHHQPDSHYSLDQVLITNNHYEPLLTTINHY